MGLREDIIAFASSHGQFTRKELAGLIASCGKDYSRAYQSVILRNLVDSGSLVRKRRGEYAWPTDAKRSFKCSPDDEIKEMYLSLRTAFPFVSFCIWNTGDILPLLHDVPALRMTVVSCTRIALKGVAEHISSLTDKLVLREPDWEMLIESAHGRPVVVVTSLVSRAPVESVDGIPCPSLEKILVDILCEEQYHYLEGSEAFALYRAAISDYRLNRKTLEAYAARRNRSREVKDILDQEYHDN